MIHSPPALTILDLAYSENYNAQTLILGTVIILSSSKTFPAIAKIFDLLDSVFAIFVNLDKEIGYLVVLD